MAESLSASNVSSLALTGVHYYLHWQFIFNLKPKNNDSLITGKLVQVTLKAIHKSHSAANNGKVSILQCITYKTINMKQGLQTMMFDMCIMPLQASMYCFRSLSCIVKHHKSFISLVYKHSQTISDDWSPQTITSIAQIIFLQPSKPVQTKYCTVDSLQLTAIN